MKALQQFITNKTPDGWTTRPFWSVFQRMKFTGFPDEELLSVYRDYGVIPKNLRNDNHNKTSDDLSNYQLVDRGWLVTNKMKAWQGSIAVSRHRGIVSPAYYAYKPLGPEHDQFLHYLLRSSNYIALYGRISKGVRINQWDLEHEALRNIPILLPSYETQKEIADFLDRETARIDQLIEKKMTFHETLKERLSSKITECILGKNSGYFDYERQNVNELWIKSIPSHWEVRKIKMISPVMRGASPRPIDDPVYFNNDGEYAWIRISDVTKSKGYLEFTEQKLSALGASKSVKLDIGKLFLSIAGSVGKPCLTKIKACIHDGFVYFPRLSKETQKYLYYIFVSGECFCSLGKLGTQLNLNTQIVGDIKVPFPPVKEQEIIAKKLDEITVAQELIIQKNLLSVEQLNNLKSSLITEAVTGQLDIQKWQQRGMTDRHLDEIEEDMKI